MEEKIIKGYILFKTGFPQDLFKEKITIFETPQEAEKAKNNFAYGYAKYLIVLPVKIIITI